MAAGQSDINAIIEAFVQEVRATYGDDLLSVMVYGSAASGDHIPGRSDINLAVILRAVTPAQLRRCLSFVARWRKRGVVPPLFLDPDFIRSSADVFPIEFLDMQARHRVVFGPDLIQGLTLGRGNLHFQCEQELKGKLLKLRQQYLEAEGSPHRLERLLVGSLSSFVVVLRHLFSLVGAAAPAGRAELIAAIPAVLGVPADALAQVARLKRGEIALGASQLEALFERYVGEIQGLAAAVDRMPS